MGRGRTERRKGELKYFINRLGLGRVIVLHSLDPNLSQVFFIKSISVYKLHGQVLPVPLGSYQVAYPQDR